MHQRPFLTASVAAAVLAAAAIALLAFLGNAPREQAPDDRILELTERLTSLETALASLKKPPPPSRVDAAAGPGSGKNQDPAAPAPQDGSAATDREPPSEEEPSLASIQDQIDVLSERLEGLEQDPVQRGYAFISSESDDLRREGIRELRRLGRFDPEARSAIRQLLGDPSAKVRAEALEALGMELKDKESVPEILELLGDREAAIRRRAVAALGAIGVPEAGPAIAHELADADERVREQAADVLGTLKTREAAESLLGALQDSSEAVRGEAIASLGEIGARSAAPALREIYNSSPGQHRMRLVLALRTLGDEQPFRMEIARLSKTAAGDPDEQRRRRAVEWLADLARREAQPVLEQALQDPSSLVREAAQRILRKRR